MSAVVPNLPGRPVRKLQTLNGVLLSALKQQQAESRVTIRWPTDRWRHNIIGFAETILGIKPYKRQRDLLLAIQDNLMVACRSGHRCAKSNSLAIAALWHHCTFDESRVAFTAPSMRQVSEVAYHEIKRLHARSGTCYECRQRGVDDGCEHSAPIGGNVRQRPSSGIRQKDGRQLWGYSAAKPGAITGIAGKNLFLIVDEAPDVDPALFEGLHGNRAGGSRLLLIGNPVRLKGEFFDAFHKNRDAWALLAISSYESPNITGEMDVPGLATLDWIEERKKAWGANSNEFKTRVLGEFAQLDMSNSPVSLAKILAANDNNDKAPQDGTLVIGLDVASHSPDGRNDETVFSIGRGKKHLAIEACDGYRVPEVAEKLFELVEQYRISGERPHLNIDVGGVGYKVVEAIERHADVSRISIARIRNNDQTRRDRKLIHNRRDEMFSALIQYLEDGGGLLRSSELEEQLPPHQWVIRHDGLATVVDKAKVRKACGRSPDHADSVMLMCLGVPPEIQPRRARPSDTPLRSPAAPSRYDPSPRRQRAPVVDPFGGRRR